jgi:hypothetical protein
VSTGPFRILVTGSREFADRPQMVRALSDASAIPGRDRQLVLRHGGARGADAVADAVWTDWHSLYARWLEPEVFMADWNQYGKKAGSMRNTRMLKELAEGEQVDVVLAFPLAKSIGTWDCIRKAEAMKIPIRNYGATT